MKMSFPPHSKASDSSVRPGFDVLMAVTGARQSASATARQLAASRFTTVDPSTADQRRQLLAHGRIAPGVAPIAIARFADVAPLGDLPGDAVNVADTGMNGLFTRAFQPMVKHRDVHPQDKADCLGGTGPGMK
jgi:hypothetical protein